VGVLEVFVPTQDHPDLKQNVKCSALVRAVGLHGWSSTRCCSTCKSHCNSVKTL